MTNDVTLSPLPRTRLDELAHFTLPPDQAGYSGLPVDLLDTPDTRDGHVILAADRPVGFFVIDRDYPAQYSFAPEGALGLRMFSINYAEQGHGFATASCRALRDYLSVQYPGRDWCYLTVNCRNPAARRVYEKGGFEESGEQYLGGALGPQHVMRLRLS